MGLEINISENYPDLCEKVTREILTLSNQKLKTQKRFTLVLSGGSTPKGVYQCMASAAFRKKFQWDKMHLFWSDERWVAHDDPKSNFRMVSAALLAKIKIPPANVHPIHTDVSLKDSARGYEQDIAGFFKLKKGQWPSFDLVLLGLGSDGHTLSLFPGTPALAVKGRLAVDVIYKGVPDPRISLTFPVANHGQAVFFLVSGEEKAGIVQRVFGDKKIYPAQQINPVSGRLAWFLDKAAAAQWPGKPQRICIAADHGGFRLKEYLTRRLQKADYKVVDFGNRKLDPVDDYPDFIIPLARAVARGEFDRGIAICGSGVGACIVANKVPGVRACMIHEKFSARQGVEDDDMNVICLGSRVLTDALAWELVTIFLASHFSGAERHCRRLAKVAALETPIKRSNANA